MRLLLPLLSGCFAVSLPQETPPDGLLKLAQLSDATLPVRITTEDLTESYRGFQYLFLVFPISRVYTPSLPTDLLLQLSIAGGLRGYSFTQLRGESVPPLYVDIRITDASVNGYDLIFVRKPTASVALEARLFEHGALKKVCSISHSASDTAHYAFSTELQIALSEALLQSSYKLLDCLEIAAIPAHQP
jgi:hypothetical protein